MTSSGEQRERVSILPHRRKTTRTLNLSHSAGENVLLGLLVAEALQDVVNDGLDEVSLLALLGLLLKADPRVEDGFDLSGEGNLLALDERLGLELRGLLLGGREHVSNVERVTKASPNADRITGCDKDEIQKIGSNDVGETGDAMAENGHEGSPWRARRDPQ